MKRAILLTFLGVLMLVSSTATATDKPKLINKKSIFPYHRNRMIQKNHGINSMRLSPDGKHLLYIRRERGNRCRIVLQNIISGKNKDLPIPAYDDVDIPMMMLSMNVFDTAGKRIVLGAGIDTNGNGVFDSSREKMKPVVYDIASGKTKDLPVQNNITIPTFDRTGKGFIIIAGDEDAKTGKLITMRAEKANPKVHNILGLPRGVCPTADVIPLLLLPDREKFILYDLKAGKQIIELPKHKKSNTILLERTPQWTGNGRYLYYPDLKDDAAKGARKPNTKPITRIWDRKTKKESGIVDDAIAIGPGPGKTTMVLAKGDHYRGKLILHDAATDKSWTLFDNSQRPMHRCITAQGKYLIYGKRIPDNKADVYLAEIALPGKAKDDKDKKPTSQPAKTKPPKAKKP